MKVIWSILIVITVLMSQSVIGSCTEQLRTQPASSNRAAKRKGTFAASVRISPDEFEWKGHKFQVHDAWLETPGKAQAKGLDYRRFCFTFGVDGKRPSEVPSEVAEDLTFKEDSGVAWRHAWTGGISFGIPNHTSSTNVRIPRHLVGRFPVHYIDAAPEQTQLELHLLDRRSDSLNEKEPPPVLSLSVIE